MYLLLGCILALAITIMGAFLYATRGGIPIFPTFTKKKNTVPAYANQLYGQATLALNSTSNVLKLCTNWVSFLGGTKSHLASINACLLSLTPPAAWLQKLSNAIATQYDTVIAFQNKVQSSRLFSDLRQIQQILSTLVRDPTDDPKGQMQNILTLLQPYIQSGGGSIYNDPNVFTQNLQIMADAKAAFSMASSNNAYAKCLNECDGGAVCLSDIATKYESAQYEKPAKVITTFNDNIVILYNMITNQETLMQ